MIIYLDVLFLVNFIINYVLLYINMRIFKISAGKTRLMIGAVIGALYAIFMYYPSLNRLYSMIAKVLFSVLMIVVTYKPVNFKQLAKWILGFYGVNFAFGGAMFAVFFLSNMGSNTNAVIKNGVYYFNISIKTLILSAIISFVIMNYVWKVFNYITVKNRELTELYITFSGKTVKVSAFLDTGNSLKDPLTQTPVVVVEQNALKELLDEGFFKILNQKNFDISKLAELSDGNFSSKLKVIPYKALGTNNGFLVGFKPDEVHISQGGCLRKIDNVLIGISAQQLSGTKEYSALLNPEISGL